MSKNTVLSKEELTNKFLIDYYLGFSGLEKKYLEKIYKIKSQQEYRTFAKGIITPWFIPELSKIMTLDNEAGRPIDEFYIITFLLQYGGQIIRKVLSKYFDDLNNNSLDGERSNSTQSRELEERIQNLEVEVTTKERFIEEGKVKISNQDEKIRSLVEKIKKLDDDLLEKDKIIAQEKGDKEKAIKSKEFIEGEFRKKNVDTSQTDKLGKDSLTNQKEKRHNKSKKNGRKKAETQNSNKSAIVNIPITQAVDMTYVDQHFSMTSREMVFYDFPWFWKNEKICEVLKTVGHIERMSIKRNFKYKTVACSIRLTKGYESIFKNGGHNICYTNKGQTYYFRMFDANISMKDIKKSYAWQAIQDVSGETNTPNSELIKKFIKKYGGHFAKVLRVFGRKYILIYFNSENDLMKALVDSAMEEELGQGLKLKSQDELIGKDGKFISRLSRRRRKLNKNMSSDSDDNDLFFDAENGTSKIHTTIQAAGDSSKTQEEASSFINQFNKLNNDFSRRVNTLDKDKDKARGILDQVEEDDTIVTDKNKRKLVTQGIRTYDDV